MKIMIAEDDAASRLILEMTLKKLGHEVVAAQDGAEAWEAFQKDYFPVAIIDWLMPRTDGAALIRMIRSLQREKYTYIIMLTILEGKSNYLKAMDAGADDFMNKPFSEDILAARLRVAERILGLRRYIHMIEDFLSICCYCKKIRLENEQWEPIEYYIEKNSNTHFSHVICPDCWEKYVQPQLDGMPSSGT